jgi:hypothetical protein
MSAAPLISGETHCDAPSRTRTDDTKARNIAAKDFYNTHRPHRALHQAAPLCLLPDGVTDLDQLRVQRRDRAGGVFHEYRLVAKVFGTHRMALRLSDRRLRIIPDPEPEPRPAAGDDDQPGEVDALFPGEDPEGDFYADAMGTA